MTEINASELQIQIQDFRKKIVAGEEVTDDELRGAIKKLHAFRASKHTTLEAASQKKGASAAKVSAKKEATNAAVDALSDLL